MTNDTTLPFPPAGHASDLPGHVSPRVAYTMAPPLVERLPDGTAGRALAIVGVGGVVAQLLFYGQFLGINVPIWVALVLGAALIVRRPGARIDRADLWIPVAALLFASFCALRTDAMLLLFDVAATGTFTLAAVVALGGQALTRRSWLTVVSYAARAIAIYLVGASYLTNGFRALPRSKDDRQTTSWRVIRGLTYALPFLVLFIVLFAGADEVFNSLLRRVVPGELVGPQLIGRFVVAAIAAWLLGGAIVCGWLTREDQKADARSDTPKRSIGSTESTVVLVSIDALFLVFVGLQAAYLFGGLDTLAVSGMTYSDYARRGFGELIFAALLAGAVLIILDNRVAEHGRVHRALAALLAALTGAVVASAFMRITLYQQAYGWTELRFYTIAAIGWLGVCAVVAVTTIAADRISLLPKLALATGLAIAVICNVVGPQSFVTQQTVARVLDPALVAPGGETGLDVEYLSSLDADAIRVLAAFARSLPASMQVNLDYALSDARKDLESDLQRGWPSWNYARQQAFEALIAAGY
jgi:hypothetical protein